MRLEIRMRQSIKRRSGVVLFRSDVASLGSQTQITYALNLLVQKGELLRLSRGIYAKAKKVVGNKIKVQGSFDAVIHEVAEKLGIKLHKQGIPFIDENTSKDKIVIETETPRIKRHIVINGQTVVFLSYCQKKKVHSNYLPLIKTIPTLGVASYVLELARYYNVSYTNNSMDSWANMVTRLAGDEVVQDFIDDLIVALKRAGKLSKKDVAILTVNYLRECKQGV